MIDNSKNFRSFFCTLKNDTYFYTGCKELCLKSIIANIIFNASLQLLLLYRCSHFCYIRGWYKLASFFEWLQIVMFSCRIEKRAYIGRNFKIAHSIGIVIGLANIGNNVSIWQNVTIGASGREKEKGKYPTIEDNVKIFANAIVVGNIQIAKNATISAMSFVNIDVPVGTTVVGIPARIIKKNSQKK